jgi:polysaccharide biosynthesis/export protein
MERVDMITICLRGKKNKIDAHRMKSQCRISPLVRLVIGLMLVGGLPGQHGHAQMLSSSSSSEKQPLVTSPEPGDKEQLQIGAGDLVDVEIFNTPELSAPKLRVDQYGNITLPAIGHPVMVGGLSTSAAAERIREQLQAAQIMPDPHVTVFILEYATQGITVLGEVKAPGTYTLLGPHSLYDALSAAGGPTPTEGASIVITHANDPSHPITIDVKSANYSELQKATIVYPGDTIVVSRAELVYVVGDVGRSGAYYMQNGRSLTVLELISLANGINRTAKMSKCSVIRKVPEGVETIRFDLGKVMQSKLANFTLLAGDVVVIPRSGLKDFGTTALPGVTNAVASATSAALIVQ